MRFLLFDQLNLIQRLNFFRMVLTPKSPIFLKSLLQFLFMLGYFPPSEFRRNITIFSVSILFRYLSDGIFCLYTVLCVTNQAPQVYTSALPLRTAE